MELAARVVKMWPNTSSISLEISPSKSLWHTIRKDVITGAFSETKDEWLLGENICQTAKTTTACAMVQIAGCKQTCSSLYACNYQEIHCSENKFLCCSNSFMIFFLISSILEQVIRNHLIEAIWQVDQILWYSNYIFEDMQ